MYSNIQNLNGRVNIIAQPKTDDLFKLYDQTKVSKSSFRDALKGNKQDNLLSNTFFSKENIQIVQNGLRAGVYKMSGDTMVIGIQSEDSIRIIMQETYIEHAKNDGRSIADQIKELNSIIFNKHVPKLHGEAIGYIKYKEDVSTIKEPIMPPMQSGDRDFKNLEFKPW